MKLHPDFPVVEGRHRLTREWELELPGKFNRRVEDGDLVLWRPGLTFFIAVWNLGEDDSAEDTLASILEDASPERTNEKIVRAGGVIRITYHLQEHDAERDPSTYLSISGAVIADCGHVQISAYCDGPEAESAGAAVIASVKLSLTA